MDSNEILKWHKIFKNNNELFEIRILGDKIYSGYFDDINIAIKEMNKFDNYQIYFTINEIKTACRSREQYNNFIQVKSGTATSKNDIEKRRFIPIDIDVERPSNVCSSNEEKEYAHQVALRVYKFFKDNNFPTPIVCDSSSGYHLYFKVDLDNNDDNEKLVKKFLSTLSLIFNDDKVKIDEQVCDANRIMRLPGTWSRKGRNTDERPYRMAKILKVPNTIEILSESKIKEFIKAYSIEQEKNNYNNYNYNNTSENNKFDLREFISKYNIEVEKEIPWNGGTKFILKQCPFNNQHLAPDSAIFLYPNGQIAFKCFHNSCSQYGWRDLRLKYEPNAYDKKDNTLNYQQRQYTPTPITNNRNIVSKPKYEIKEETPELGKKWLNLSEIQKIDLSQIETIKTGITELDNAISGLAMGELSILSGSNACVDCDTEFFNGNRWKKISEYTEGEKVLQYNADGTAELVTPIKYIKEKCDLLHLMQTKGVNQCLQDENRVIYESSQGNLRELSMKEVIKRHNESPMGFNGRIITSFMYNGNYQEFTDDELRFLVAFQADGSILSKNRVAFRIKKNKKFLRLLELLKNINAEYRVAKNTLDFGVYIKTDERIKKLCVKKFPKTFMKYSIRQKEIILDELKYWDSTIRRANSFVYYTTIKENIEVITFFFFFINKRCNITIVDRVIKKKKTCPQYTYKKILYQIYIADKQNYIFDSSAKRGYITDYVPKDGYKYCFQVPSSMLVLRREGLINITGNSGKSSWINQLLVNVVQQNYKVALWSGELQPRILKIWLYLCIAGARNVAKSKYDDKYYVPNNISEKIDLWLNNKFYLYNNDYSNKWEQIFNDFKEMIDKGVKFFVLDNLFSLDIDIFDGDNNRKQKELIIQICEFVKKNNVHLLLVAHPRKTSGFLRKNDISGSSDIMNAASNIFICHRVNTDFVRLGKEFFGASKIDSLSIYGNVIEICKNRLYGADGVMCGMYYDIPSRRFKNTPEEDIAYGWEDSMEIPHIVNPFQDDYFNDNNNNVPY